MSTQTASPFKRHEHCITRALWPFLQSRSKTPFEYGINDCAFFAGDAIVAMTGVDVLIDFRGQYSDGPSALRAIQQITGGKSVSDAADWVTSKFGMNALPSPLYAQRGDLVLCTYTDAEGDTEFLGIVAPSGDVAIPGKEGITHLPLSSAKKGWKV
jgi:hypothetical protein